MLQDSDKRARVLLGVAILGLGIAFISSYSLVGREARLVDVTTIFFTAFGAGAALIDALRGLRGSRDDGAVAGRSAD